MSKFVPTEGKARELLASKAIDVNYDDTHQASHATAISVLNELLSHYSVLPQLLRAVSW